MTRDIHHLLTQQFPAARTARLGDDDDLLEAGILDSVGVLDLVARLESDFNISVVDEDLTPENFRTIAALSAFVLAKRPGVANVDARRE